MDGELVAPVSRITENCKSVMLFQHLVCTPTAQILTDEAEVLARYDIRDGHFDATVTNVEVPCQDNYNQQSASTRTPPAKTLTWCLELSRAQEDEATGGVGDLLRLIGRLPASRA